MPAEYIPIFLFAVVVAAVPAVGFGMARRAGRAASPVEPANAPGEPLAFEETERRNNSSQIYLVGALFVICDATIIILVPWAVRFSELGAFGLAGIAGLAGALACGYVWLYRKRALERL
jgi:NADH:ubiquinone oxidoreductase subunit 3 (subunit A)